MLAKFQRQLITSLADKPSADVPGMGCWQLGTARLVRKLFWLGSLLSLVVAIELPLQSLLVGEDIVQVATCY